jgi:hypothetical protein
MVEETALELAADLGDAGAPPPAALAGSLGLVGDALLVELARRVAELEKLTQRQRRAVRHLVDLLEAGRRPRA